MGSENSTILRKWGNSQGVILPKGVLDQVGFKLNDSLDIDLRENGLLLTRTFTHKSFEDRVRAYGGKVSAYVFDWGDPEGRELL